MQRRQWIGWALGAIAVGTVVSNLARAQDDQAARMTAALAASERPAEAKARDATRRPTEVVQFLGIETGMTVLDVIAAGGWYTEVLSAAVGPDGTVLSQNPEFFLNREGFAAAEQALVERLGNVEPVHGDIAAAGIEGRVDVAISALNLHDLYNGGGADAALPLLQSIYDALKPGGVFGLIDHRGIAGQDNAALHRMEASAARRLLTQVGFIVEAESGLLANVADDRLRGAGDEALARNTDRFLMRARK
jgi:predicted methyltransferase